MTLPTLTTAAPRAATRARIDALDVLRGVALCGVLLVNIGPVTGFGRDVGLGAPTLSDPSGWLQLLVQQRFVPVFSLLFGIGFSLALESAAARTDAPRAALARRLAVLLPLGALHQVWHPGEALLIYAVTGLAVLLPSSWLPRPVVAVAAVVLVPAGVASGGGLALVPGMFLLGSALVRYGVVDRMGTSRWALRLLALFAVASAPAVAWQLRDVAGSGFTTSSAVAGLLMAGAYVTGVLALLRTPLRRALHAAFAPLGRTALSCYVTATPIMVAAAPVLDLPGSRSWATLMAVAAGILVLQWTLATLWLRRARQGPLEWLWRWATWGRREPLLRQ